jgi:hypothetical protein
MTTMGTTDQGRCVHCYRVTGFYHPVKKEWICIPKCPPPCTPSDPPELEIKPDRKPNRKERRANRARWNS